MLSITILLILYYLFFYEKVWNKIILGASLPLSGINKELGQEVYTGANAYFKYINEHGGISGKKIVFIKYDDKYEPQNTIKNAKKLIIKDNVFALFDFVGTPTTKAILPFLDDTPLIAPYTGASIFRNRTNTNIINFRSSYREEIENIINYLYINKKIRRFAIFYQNDDYGISGYNATVKTLQEHKLKLYGEGTYRRNTISVDQALHEIGQSNPEAIILVGAYKSTARFIKLWRERHSTKTLFAPISFVNANALVNQLHKDAKGIYFSLTVPSYDDKNLDVATEYRWIFSKYYPKSHLSYASFESFLAAKAVVGALKKIHGSITRKKFIEQLKNINPDIVGKLSISYKNTQLLNQVYLSIFEDGKFLLINRTNK